MFGDMMGKIKETQKKVEETKRRLDTVTLQEKSSDGLLIVTVTASRKVKNIEIANELLNNKQQLEDNLLLVMNNAFAKAEHIYNLELAAVAKEGMPNIPGLDLF